MTADGPFDPPFPDDTLSKGWRFELHMEKVKKSDTWLRARTGFVRAHLLLLWSEAWEQSPCGTLPDDDELIALLLDMAPEDFAKHRAVLMRGWTLASNGRLYHETITDRVLAMLEKRKSDAQRTAASRARRSGQQPGHAGDARVSHVTHGGVTGEFNTKHQNHAPDTSSDDGNIATPTNTAPPLPGGLPRGRWGDGGGASAPPSPKPRKNHGTDDDHKAAHWMFERLREVNATAKEPGWDKWANEIRLMREQDGRGHREMCELFSWVQRDPFWSANVMSPSKLREKWDQLAANRERARSAAPGAAHGNKQEVLEAGNFAAAGRFASEGGDDASQ